MAFEIGDQVVWNWGRGEGMGRVEEIHESRVERVIKGSRIVRNATPDNPAYVIRQADGGEVLKAHSELSHA